MQRGHGACRINADKPVSLCATFRRVLQIAHFITGAQFVKSRANGGGSHGTQPQTTDVLAVFVAGEIAH